MFNFFDAKEPIRYGAELGEEFVKKLKTINQKSISKRDEKWMKLQNDIFKKSQAFGAGQKLNFYKTSQLCNAFKWKLLDGGVDKDVAESLARHIAIALKKL